jgi:glycine oxidase
MESAAPEAAFAERSAGMWPEFAAEIEKQSDRPVHFRRDGALIAAATPEHLEQLLKHASGGMTVLSREEALRLEPLLRADIAGALLAPDDAQVDNRALGLALAHAFVRAGGRLRTNEAVVRLELAGGRATGARTPFALYQGDALVIAAGAWSGLIEGIPGEALPPVMPVKGEMVALGAEVGLPTHLVWGEDVYLIPRHDRLMIGATTSRAGFDSSLSDAARDFLLARARALMPGLSNWPVVEHWAGLRPGSPDDLPLIGETAVPGLFVASGQYRNGILFAPAIADALHSLILEHRLPPDVRAFDPKRFTLAGGTGVR